MIFPGIASTYEASSTVGGSHADHRENPPLSDRDARLFNVIWWYARRDRRLLTTTIDSAGVRAIARRFQLALAWIATGILLGTVLPVLGLAVIAALIPYYWLPIAGEIAKAKRRHDRGGHAELLGAHLAKSVLGRLLQVCRPLRSI
jgi:hypothetical protein